MASEQFSLCWDNFHRNMSMGMQSLLETEDLVDVTLAVEGKCLKAHKMVLSVCSPYFRELFQSNPCKHPIVFMKDVSYIALTDLLQFMYQGEVQVAQENLSTFIKTAEALQIKGLTGDSGVQNDIEVEDMEKPFVESSKRSHEDTKQTPTNRVKKLAGPASKRAKMSPVQSTPVRQSSTSFVSTGNKFEVASVNTNDVQTTEEAELKLEPEPNEQLESDMVNETQIEQYADDSNVDDVGDDVEDFSLMESSADEPKASTSTDAGGESQGIKMEPDSENEISCTSPDIAEPPKITSLNLLPEKSRQKYQTAYKLFMDWRRLKNNISISENLLLSYFNELSQNYKSSSLWARYSMLKSTLNINDSINIESYTNLLAFLKGKSIGYCPKKSKTLSPVHVTKFLNEAPDEKYLATKVALIMGVMGACRVNELHAMNIEDFEDLGSAVMVSVLNTKTNITRTFTITGSFYEIYKRYAALRPANVALNTFFLNYQKGKCTTQRIGINKFGAMGKQIALYLKLANPELYTGHCFRRSSSTLFVDVGGNINPLRRRGGWRSIAVAEPFIDNS